MRYAVVLITLNLLQHLNLYSQDALHQYIPIPPEELSVNQFLSHIEEVTDLPLAYSNAIIEDKKLYIRADSLKLLELLDTLFAKQHVNYYLYDGQLVLAPQTQVMAKSNLIGIAGVIKNFKTSKYIPYVNIYVPNQSTGTISNYEGEFEFFIPRNESIDTIGVSCLGYTQQFIPVSQFEEGQIEVLLEPLKFQINELIVRPHDPNDLVYLAIKNKERNYSNKSGLYSAFFRETTQINDVYVSLSEATIDIYKTPYSSEENDLVKLNKGRKERTLQTDQEVNLVVEGGLYNSMQLDIVKYGVNFFDIQFMQFYEYEFLRQTSYNNRQTYSIAFRLKDQKDFIGFNGIMYIDASTMGIVRVEFSIDPRSLTHAYPWIVKRVPKEFRVVPRYGDYRVEYRLYNGLWNLYYARSEIAIKIRKRKRDNSSQKTISLYKSSSEFVITGKTKGEFERIKYRDASKPQDVLYEQITAVDTNFWGTETVIVPEEPLVETIKKLEAAEIGDVRQE